MKDDLESFNKAMIEDLKAAGFKESEIKLMTEQDSADDEENSVERKRRKTLNKLQSGGQPQSITKKQVSKKERARLAF